MNLAYFRANWKTTVQSILTSTFALTGALMVSSVISHRTAAILTTVNAVSKILVGLLQSDGLQLPPGSKMEQHTSIETPASNSPEVKP